jgi:hypothetical protein
MLAMQTAWSAPAWARHCGVFRVRGSAAGKNAVPLNAKASGLGCADEACVDPVAGTVDPVPPALQ